ncbi:MAG: FAD-binding protein [Desulfobacteraceae bacterium]
MNMTVKHCDVLVVGSGLSGLRAGISALHEDNSLSVLLVSNGKGPSGSSFTNRNQCLGMVVCHDDRESDVFIDAVKSIAAPGIIYSRLPELMAKESERLFDDLRQSGFKFKPCGTDGFERFTCCYIKEPKLAYVFTDLPSAFQAMRQRFERSGGTMLEGFTLKDLIPIVNSSVEGAVFVEQHTGGHLVVRAKSVILSTGGSAGLFKRSLAGKENLGFATALMGGLGVAYVNMPFVQYLWYDVQTLQHWPCWQIANPGVLIACPGGESVHATQEIMELCVTRSHHVPLAHGRPDSSVDNMLLNHLQSDGTVRIFSPDKGWFTVAPFAHAMNGGAAINEHSETNIKGLFACGECAGGMHGANRVGGAMVLATQVFGELAGIHGARHAQGLEFTDVKRFMRIVEDRLSMLHHDDSEWHSGLAAIRKLLEAVSGPWPRGELSSVKNALGNLLHSSKDWRLNLAFKTARMIADV